MGRVVERTGTPDAIHRAHAEGRIPPHRYRFHFVGRPNGRRWEGSNVFKMRSTDRLESLAEWSADFASGPWGTHAGFGLLAFWLGAAVAVGWSEAYQYVDEIVTMSSFLLLFLLQRAQAKDTLAMQVKLNELLAAVNKASGTLINLEDRPESEVQQIHDMYEKLQRGNGHSSSIDDLAEDVGTEARR